MHRLPFLLMLAFAPLASAGAQAAGAPTDPLRPGDRILVRVWVDSAFADSARVDERLMTVLPAAGALSLAGLSPSAVSDSVRRVYRRMLRDPAVEVTPLRRVIVSGEARRPGVYFVEPGTTLREAVAIAGGITESGTPSRLQVSRDSTQLRVADWERRADAFVHSGDVIWIGRESWIRRNSLTIVSAVGVITSLVVTLAR